MQKNSKNHLQFLFIINQIYIAKKMKREFEAIENDYNSVKEKFEAAKIRNKVLGNENKTLKDQVKTLLEKGKHDDELVDALMVRTFRIRF